MSCEYQDNCTDCGEYQKFVCSECLYKAKSELDNKIQDIKVILQRIVETKFKHEKTCNLETHGYYPIDGPYCSCELQDYDHEFHKVTSIDVILTNLIEKL